MTEDWRQGGFGVYLHWPFCAAKCPYCDFNSHVRRSIDQARWRRALVSEVRRVAAEVPGRRVDTIFFGGGTPSLMPPETVAEAIGAVRDAWTLAPDAEITLEANPTSVEAGRFRAYREAGVNRLSLGVQSLHDADLAALGRRHTAAEAIRAFETARATFPRVSFDLIYARQGQTAAAWRAELDQALELAIDHLSLYQLTIEPETRFGELAALGKLRGLPTDAVAAELYETTGEACARAGLDAYEVSNHAAPGAESRHNLIYWRYGDYAGIGPGAHGRLTRGGRRFAVAARRSPEAWLDAVERSGSGDEARTELTGEEQSVEMAMMGLRLAEGIAPARFAALAGRPLSEAALDRLAAGGWIERTADRVRVTGAGRPVLNSVLKNILLQ